MNASMEMPKYRCHKEVWALKIKKLLHYPGHVDIVPEEIGYGEVRVSREYFKKHEPTVGGYYVLYRDGYESFSPAEAFEEGYTLIPSTISGSPE